MDANLWVFVKYLAEHSPAFAHVPDKDALIAELGRSIEAVYAPAWRAHPDYWPSKEDPHNPTVVAVFAHPEYRGHSESYVIARVGDVLSPANLRWAARTLGDFKCLRPIRNDWQVSKTRIGYISWSLRGKGNAFRCREELKQLLPRKYRPLITLARRIATTPKTAYLKAWMLDHPGANLRDKSVLPDWYKAASRDELNFGKFAEHAASRAHGLANYITLENLWRIVTGQIHPDAVPNFINHQPLLLDD